MFAVTDSELKRLKDAFKRSATLGGYMNRQTFIREVLGDGVPQRMADVSILKNPAEYCPTLNPPTLEAVSSLP